MEQQKKMVKLSVEVRSGAARFRVGVQARDIRETRRLVGGRYPRGVVQMASPAQAESYFVPERTRDVAA